MFAIAETVGGCTVDELSRRMSTGEMLEWKEYFDIKNEKYEEEADKAKNKTPRR